MELSKPKVVVGLDFGTTFSGFAYAHITGLDDVKTFYDYPKAGRSVKPYCKTLTGSYYKKVGGVWQFKSWGYPALTEYERDFTAMRKQRSIGPSSDPLQPTVGTYITKFKLHLASKDTGPSSAEGLPPGLTVKVLITDYLREMGALILKTLQNYYGVHLTKQAVQWCVAFPSIWDNSAKVMMQTCMMDAGLVNGVDGSPHPLIMVLEPEAASFHCHKVMSEQILRVGDKLLVADIGGGTSDIVVQEVVSVRNSGYRVKEVTISSGGLCGGTYIDTRFMEFLHKIIGPCLQECIFKNPNISLRLIRAWESTKISFGDGASTEESITLLGKVAREWEYYDRRMGKPPRDSYDELEISVQEMQSIFDPIIEQNLQLIACQLEQVGAVKVLVVVGGFAGSPYLMNCIKQRFSSLVPKIISPPNPGSAVCQGAVALALYPGSIDSRICKKTYGFYAVEPFEEGIDPPALKQFYDGVAKCNNRFKIYVIKGDLVKEDDCFSRLFMPILDGQTAIELDLYSTEESNLRYIEGDKVRSEGKFVIDISEDMRLQKDRQLKVSLYFGRSSIEIKTEGLNFSVGSQQFQVPVEACFSAPDVGNAIDPLIRQPKFGNDGVLSKELVKETINSMKRFLLTMEELLKKVQIWRNQCKHLLDKFQGGFQIISQELVKEGHPRACNPSSVVKIICSKFIYCMLEGRALLLFCSKSNNYTKAAFALSSPPPSVPAFSRFAVALREVDWILDFSYNIQGSSSFGDWKWCETRCRLVLDHPSIVTTKSGLMEDETLTADGSRDLVDREEFQASLNQKRSWFWTRNEFQDKLASIWRNRMLPSSSTSGPNSVPDCFWIQNPSDFKHVDHIRNGAFKVVDKSKWLGTMVAVAIITNISRQHLEVEAGILAKVQHPNVVELIGCAYKEDGPNDPKGFLITELMEKDLESLIRCQQRENNGGNMEAPPFAFQVAVDIALQIVEAMIHLKDSGVIHRDLKPGNCLASAKYQKDCWPGYYLIYYSIKLTDFGTSKIRGQDSYFHTRRLGSPWYMAPELYGMPEENWPYTWSADVYSFGMTCYKIFTGKDPFKTNRFRDVSTIICQGKRPAFPSHFPRVLRGLIENCWAQDPGARPAFKDIREKLWRMKLQVMPFE